MTASCRSWRNGVLAGVLLLLVLVPGGRVRGEDGPLESDQRLFYTSWKVEFLNRSQRGACCWLADGEGNLRAEIQIGKGNLDSLLDWRGDSGWTLIDAVDGDGTMSRWFEEWQPVDPELRGWVRFLPSVLNPEGALALPPGIRVLESGQAIVPARGPFTGVPAVESYEVSSLNTARTRGRALPRRGLGRGGPEATVRLWRAEQTQARTTVTSSRQAGRLEFLPVQTYRVSFDTAAFLPWWPLRSVLKFP